MCLHVRGCFFPRTDVLHNLPAYGSGLFGGKGLRFRDAELLPVRAGIKSMFAQGACRELFEGLAADKAFNGVFLDTFFPVRWYRLCVFDLPFPSHFALKDVVFTCLELEQAGMGFCELLVQVLWRKELSFDERECQVFCHFSKRLCHVMFLIFKR